MKVSKLHQLKKNGNLYIGMHSILKKKVSQKIVRKIDIENVTRVFLN